MLHLLRLTTLVVLCLLFWHRAKGSDIIEVNSADLDAMTQGDGSATHFINGIGPTRLSPRRGSAPGHPSPPPGHSGGGPSYSPTIVAEFYNEWNCAGKVQYTVYLLNGDKGRCIEISKGADSGYHGIVLRFNGQLFSGGSCKDIGSNPPKTNECQHFTKGWSITGMRLD